MLHRGGGHRHRGRPEAGPLRLEGVDGGAEDDEPEILEPDLREPQQLAPLVPPLRLRPP